MANRALQHAHEPVPQFSEPKKAPAKKKRSKSRVKSRAKLFLYIIISFTMGFLVVSRYVAVDESGRELRAARNELAAIESRNQQLQMQIDREIAEIDVYLIATEEFGMRRLENHQTFNININTANFGERISQLQRDGRILQGVPGILVNAIQTLR